MNSTRCLLEGFTWLVRPGLRKLIWIPLLINSLLFSIAIWLLTQWFNTLMDHFLPSNSWLHYLRWLLWPFIAFMLILAVFYTFNLISNLIASPFNSFLSAAVEQIETGVSPNNGYSLFEEIRMSIHQEFHKMLYFLTRFFIIFILGFIPIVNIAMPFLWFIYVAWSNYLQYMDYPMGNHGILFYQQRRYLAYRILDMLGFGGMVSIMLTIPVLNLITMPVAVIGATLHYTRDITPYLRASNTYSYK